MRHLLDVQHTNVGGWHVLSAAGELDLASAPRLAVRVREIVRSGATTICIDLSDVEFIDSAGLAVLINAQRALARVEGRLLIVAPPEGRVSRLLDLCGVRAALDVVEDVDAALASTV